MGKHNVKMLLFSGAKTHKSRYLLSPPTYMVLIHPTALIEITLLPQHPLTLPHNGEYCKFKYFTKNS